MVKDEMQSDGIVTICIEYSIWYMDLNFHTAILKNLLMHKHVVHTTLHWVLIAIKVGMRSSAGLFTKTRVI